MQLKSLQKFVYLFVFILLGGALGYAGGLGCETAGPGPTPTPTPIPTATPTASPTATPIVDVVMGDLSGQVHIFYDVLNLPATPTPTANVILDTADVTMPHRVLIDIADNLLIVANTENPGSILIYNGFTGLTPTPTPIPDVILNDAAMQVDNVTDIALAPGAVGNDLYVANLDSVILVGSNVTIFRDIATVASPDPANVSLDMDVADAQALTVANNRLYVCDGSSDEVLIFNNASGIASNVAPNVVLDNATSMINNCGRVKVFNNTLFVINDFDSNAETVLIFNNADAITMAVPPNAILSADAPSLVRDARDVFATDSGRLFVAKEDFADNNGVLGFDLPFVDDQLPNLLLVNPLDDCEGIDGVLGTVFAGCDSSTPFPSDGVYGYLNADGVSSGNPPDILLDASNAGDPIGLDVEVRP